MEITAGNNITAICKHQRIVRGTVHFNSGDVTNVLHSFTNRSVDLWDTAKAVSILNASTVEVRLPDFTFLKKAGEPFRHLQLSAMRTCLMDPRIERYGRTLQRFERHRSRQVGHIEKLSGALPTDQSRCQRRLRSVHKSKTFLCSELQRCDADGLERFPAGDPGRFAEDFAFADQHERQMSQRSKITARTHTAAAGNDGIDMMIQQVAEAFDNDRSGSG